MTEQIQKTLKKNNILRQNYFATMFGIIILGGILVYENLLWLPVVQIFLIIAYKIGTNNYKKNIIRVANYASNIIQNVERSNHHIVSHMQVGLAVFSPDNALQWCNFKFKEIADKINVSDFPLEELIPVQPDTFALLSKKESSRHFINIGNRVYSMESRKIVSQDEDNDILDSKHNFNGLAIYLYDYTDYATLRQKYDDEKLALCYIRFDNYEEISRNLSDSGVITLHADTTGMLTKWVDDYHGFIVNMSSEIALVGFSHFELGRIIKTKFNILDNLHNITSSGRMSPTFSMGIAKFGISLNDLLDKAQQALDLALSRGGDQVAIDNNGQFEFFGATNVVSNKTNKVKVRITAQALREQMEMAENILIVGHVQEDLDAYGASIGVAAMAKFLQKPVQIVTGNLIGEIKRSFQVFQDANTENPYEKITIEGKEEAIKFINPHTLLIMVDHHRSQLCSLPELIDLVPNKVIIDHHRRSKDIVANVPLIYQEPSSSSTSEMITELLPYFDESFELTKLEATYLYNGIMLDTKKFTVQTGERTFEAAAFLRRSGANLQIANEIFAEKFDNLRIKAKLLANSRLIAPNFSLAVNKNMENNQYSSVIASQIADEMVQSSEIHGACVITEYKDGGCSLNARSDGNKFNVQIMMEALGGGGHQLAAACQMPDKNAKEAEALLLAEINKQMEEK